MPLSANASDAKDLAEAVRTACLQAALDAYEDASIRGLCHEGAWECAVGAIRVLDIDGIVQKHALMPPSAPPVSQ